MNSIVQVNQLPNPSRLLVGQAIVIPDATTPYIIKSGDTLWALSNLFGVSIQSILYANPTINPYNLVPGTTIYIPLIMHPVQQGELLWQIAARYGTTVQAIVDLNGLRNPNNIFPGMVLLIPRKKQPIEINAYTYQSDENGAESVNEVGHLLTYFSPFAYLIKEDGTLQPFSDEKMLNAAKSHQALPMLTITNLSATSTGTNLAQTVLSDPMLRERLIDNCLRIMEEKGYRGLNVDFE